MNDELRKRVDQLPETIADAIDTVDGALEDKTRERFLAAHEKVRAAVVVYQELVAALAGSADQAQFENRFERRLTDLKRLAARLPVGETGRATERARDAGIVPFIEQRAPGQRIQEVPASGARGERPRYTTGGEVDAWCGPCSGVRTHNIYALVQGEPQQVICQACGAKHNFRTAAPKKRGLAEAGPGLRTPSHKPTREQLEAEKKAEERRVLHNELANASLVRAYSPRERYKAGEVIEHPSLGRGKIETVTKRSLLVRFNVGLRPLELH